MKKKKKNQRPYQIQRQKDETQEQGIARAMLNPLFHAAATVQDYVLTSDSVDLSDLVRALEHQVRAVEEGNFERLEEILIAQAYTLDVVTNHLLRRSIIQEKARFIESFLKLGLKAQNQCRTTIEALMRAKNPKTHLNQTNIGYNQQVNNEIAQSKLSSEEMDGERLDPETPQEAIRGDQTLETVGEKHRAKNAGRKG